MDKHSSPQQLLTNVQLKILTAFHHQLSEMDLIFFRNVIAQHFAERAIAVADQVGMSKVGMNKKLPIYYMRRIGIW